MANPAAVGELGRAAASGVKSTIPSLIAPNNSSKASQTQPASMPPGLYAAWLAQQQAEGGTAYNLKASSKDANHPVWQSSNPTRGLKMTFDTQAVKVNGWSIVLSSLGGEKTAVKPVVKANRIDYQHGNGLNEWYVNGPMGLEQGFTLAQALPQTGKDGWLSLPVSFAGASVQRSSGQSQDWLTVLGANGEKLAQYGHLFTADASGKELETELTSSADGKAGSIADKAGRRKLSSND